MCSISQWKFHFSFIIDPLVARSRSTNVAMLVSRSFNRVFDEWRERRSLFGQFLFFSLTIHKHRSWRFREIHKSHFHSTTCPRHRCNRLTFSTTGTGTGCKCFNRTVPNRPVTGTGYNSGPMIGKENIVKVKWIPVEKFRAWTAKSITHCCSIASADVSIKFILIDVVKWLAVRSFFVKVCPNLLPTSPCTLWHCASSRWMCWKSCSASMRWKEGSKECRRRKVDENALVAIRFEHVHSSPTWRQIDPSSLVKRRWLNVWCLFGVANGPFWLLFFVLCLQCIISLFLHAQSRLDYVRVAWKWRKKNDSYAKLAVRH